MKYILYFFTLVFFLCLISCTGSRGDAAIIKRVDSLNKEAWDLRKKEREEAQSKVTEALNISQSLNNIYHFGIGQAYKTLGALNVYVGKKEEGLKYYFWADTAFTKERIKISEAETGRASVHLLIGNVKNSQGKYYSAIAIYLDGLDLAKEVKEPLLHADIRSMIAKVNIRLDSFKVAQDNYEIAICLKVKNNDGPIRLAITYFSYASLLSQTVKLYSAMYYYELAYSLFRDAGSEWGMGNVYSGFGSVLLQQGHYLRALESYEESMKMKKRMGDAEGIARSNHQIGNALFELDSLDKAKLHFEKCLAHADSLEMLELKSDAHLGLSKIATRLGVYKGALKDYQMYIQIQDSLMNHKTQVEIADLQENYENAKNEKIILITNKNTFLNYLIGAVSTALFLVIVIAFITVNFYKQKRRNANMILSQKEEIHKQKLVNLSKETELRAFNSLIDGQEIERKRIAETLHDSMGSLLSAIQLHFNSISSQLKVEKVEFKELWEKTLKLLQEATNYNRNLAYQMMPPTLIKFGLPAAIGHLADRVKVPGIKVETSLYGLKERLPEKMELILYRAIDELLNNVIKHAKATEVDIQLTAHDNELNVIVNDNGVGFEFDPLNPNYGMGLNNIQSRIKNFNGKFTIDSSPGKGTTVIINVPVK